MIFSGEIAWVTGGSTGIGRAAALALAREGCRVAVHYNSSEAEATEVVWEAEAIGREAMAVGDDVSEPDEVRRMAGNVEARFGGVDMLMLVNNAGALGRRTPFKEITPDLWDRVLDVNLKYVLL